MKAVWAALLVVGLFAGPALAEDSCRLPSSYDGIAHEPSYRVSFVFTGVDHELVELSVGGTSIFKAELTTEDWSTEFSGATECMLAGRYSIYAKIGEAKGMIEFDVSETTTIYLSANDDVLDFNIWGPDAPGLD